jgi:hypothetical protein
MMLFIMWGVIPNYAVLTGVGDQFYLMMAYNVYVLESVRVHHRTPFVLTKKRPVAPS